MLEQLLEEINFQRTKEMRQLMKDGEWHLIILCIFPVYLYFLAQKILQRILFDLCLC